VQSHNIALLEASRQKLYRPAAPKIVLPGFASPRGIHRGMEPIDWRKLGLYPGIAGGSRGVNTEGDVLTTTTDGRDLNQLWADFQAILGAWNAQRQAIINFLTFTVTEPVEDVPQVPTVDFEEASEFGEPKRIRGVSYFSLAYDFRWYDIGVSYTWKFLLGASANQLATLNNQVLEADNRLVFSRVLKAIFNNVNRTTDLNGTVYNVYPFYNNDGTVPPPWKNNTHLSTHTHFLNSASTTTNIYDATDLDAIETHLTHHGFGADVGSRIVLMFNSANTAIVRGLRAGVANSKYDFIPSTSQPAFLASGLVGGGQPAGTIAGLNVIGSWGNLLIVEDDWMPAGYIFGFATGGANAADNPVGIRENPRAPGLRLVKGAQPDYPLIDSFYNRGLVTGVRKRGAGVVMDIVTAPGTGYTIPTAYV